MIGYLSGKILENGEGKLLLGVSFAQGSVGYAVSVPAHLRYMALVPGSAIELFVHTHVREDALDLYGFANAAEKELFLTLLTVNGIGPKGALGILSGAEVESLIQAILEGDRAYLTKIPGIGKKTAERVMLELVDPIQKKIKAGIFPAPGAARAGIGPAVRRGNSAEPAAVRDAREALVGLGYREQDVSQVMQRLLTDGDAPKAETLIKTALKQLSGPNL